MGRVSFATRLPANIESDLRGRLIESHFTNYESHAEWLANLGYKTSVSALHRYGQSLEAEIEDEMDLRMRCLEVASKVADSYALILTAERLLQWVNNGRQ